ncbi:AidA/PixA family protein [Burkholderia stabilis]|uniref:AidA/PixA family protein n=1 Tax=Burkholderia stabilis TaxID=95485 RepID=UPI001F4BC121|nr:AidA/PixA family protein [Burkholderia stabilis]
MEFDPNSVSLEQTPQLIQILAIIDTNHVKKSYSNPSKSASHPTPISSNAVFMVNSRLPGVSSSEGTGNLSLKLHVGDKVSLMGTSLSDNSGDSAVIYNVRHFSGDQVFTPFVVQTIEQGEAPSAAETPDIVAISAQSQAFQRFYSSARASGSENLGTSFALYTRDQNKKSLFGYFFWTWQASAA